MNKIQLTIGAACLAAGALQAQTTKPNIIFIMCDDMGYGDLGCYGQPFIRTPHIDRMASQGMRFTQAYAGSPVSAPSRSCLMTGQHTGHAEVRGNKEYWRDVPMVQYGVNEEFSRVGQHPYDSAHVVLPEVMKAAGYRTAMFGKWAGGYEGSHSTPDKRGIDRFYGYICQYQAHLYYPNFLNRYYPQLGDTAVVRVLLEDNIRYPQHGPAYFLRSQYSADMIHHEALEWLAEQSADQPFFALLTYTLPHAELNQPNDSILATYRTQFANDRNWVGGDWSRYNDSEHTHAQFAAMITRLDHYVGEILDKLGEMGLDSNTLVIFTSDNGPHEEGGADPAFFGRDGQLRGIKRQCYEGGIRIPFIAWWPGKVQPATTNHHPLAFYDVLPTLCQLSGTSLATFGDDSDFDGISFAPTLLDKEGQQQHEFLYWEFHETDQMALRMGDWKLIVDHGTPRLYNLAEDLHEDHDIASLHPEIVQQMIHKILQEHTESPYFKVTLPQGK